MLRNIDVPGAKEIFAKQDELLVTFWMNKGWVKAINILHDEIKKDFIEEKMKKMRAENKARIAREYYKEKGVDPYETAAAAFYKRYGTQGEF